MRWQNRECSRCGALFFASPTGGRPRTRCDPCRSNHARNDGTAWRKIRAQVLAEEPICAVQGCFRPSTEVDHIIPLARGGSPLDRDNLQGMCKPHNASKGARVARPAVVVRRRCTHPACPDPTTCRGHWHV
jgi:5-methylcytosine-specific restriction endonuclease McrA